MKFIKKTLVPGLIFASYCLLNYIFNFNIWHYSIFKVPNTLVVFGEWPVYEYVAEIVRNNILSGRNPFAEAPLLFPFSWNFALEDVAPINGFYFLFLRPFFSVHDAFLIITLFGIVASCLFMYILLRELNIRRAIAYTLSLAYGYSPFVVARLGHPTYTALYLFPLLAIFFIKLLRSQNRRSAILSSVSLGIICTIVVLTNLYFAVMVGLAAIFLLGFFFTRDRKLLLAFLKSKIVYLLIACMASLLLLYPWLTKVYRSQLFNQSHHFNVAFDSLLFSADLFGILKVSTTGLVFGNFIEYLSSIFAFKPTFENLVYPGALILIGLGAFIFYRSRLASKTRHKLNPIFFTALCFWILTLGPKLHIFGFETSLPLPFKILNHIPFVEWARAPARFIVPFIFFTTILVAFVANDFAKKIYKNRFLYSLLCTIAIMIFFIDQSYTASFGQVLNIIPQKIYERVEKAPRGSVLEIPFTIRDGLQYVGDFNAVWAPRTQLLYNKPKFSVYAGRLNQSVFDYYREDPFIGYIASQIDVNSKSKKVIDLIAMKESIEFFGLENIILKQGETYTEKISKLLVGLGYEKIIDDNGYSLYNKQTLQKEFITINLPKPSERFYFGYGWGPIETSGRWIVDRVATIFIKINNPEPLQFDFEALTLSDNQEATININGKALYKIKFEKAKKNYRIILRPNLKKGINRITIIFDKTVQPSKLYPNNKDVRNLSVFFSKVRFSKL